MGGFCVETDLLDLTADLQEIVQLAGQPGNVDDLLSKSLEYLTDVIPYDLAAILELKGERLSVRCARGPLANPKVLSHSISLSEFPSVRLALETRRPKIFQEKDHKHGEGDPYHKVLDLPHGHSCMVLPLFSGYRVLGALTFDRTECVSYEPPMVNLAGIYAQIISLALMAAEQAELLNRYSLQLQEENRLLTNEVTGENDPGSILESSKNVTVRQIAQMARQVALTDTPVLILGETGVGKEILARAIHGWSPRNNQPFIKINCASLPENLLESELFGHAKGAFTGATSSRSGRFAVANGGTLLLDEIGDLPLNAQAKLLRVLQEGTFEPVGSDRTVKVNVRILAATHVDLEKATTERLFREDLLYRLNVFPLNLPPLRERIEDVMSIAEGFLSGLTRRTGRGPWRIPPETLARLTRYHWPGNVRELVNCLERATILHPQGDLQVEVGSVPLSSAGPGWVGDIPESEDWPSLIDLERSYINRVLQKTRGKIYGVKSASEVLGLKPTTLQSRMRKLGIKRKPISSNPD